MSTASALSVLFAAVIVGVLAFVIAGAIHDARRPQPPTIPIPVRKPCGCPHCADDGMGVSAEFHLRLWEAELA